MYIVQTLNRPFHLDLEVEILVAPIYVTGLGFFLFHSSSLIDSQSFSIYLDGTQRNIYIYIFFNINYIELNTCTNLNLTIGTLFILNYHWCLLFSPSSVGTIALENN